MLARSVRLSGAECDGLLEGRWFDPGPSSRVARFAGLARAPRAASKRSAFRSLGQRAGCAGSRRSDGGPEWAAPAQVGRGDGLLSQHAAAERGADAGLRNAKFRPPSRFARFALAGALRARATRCAFRSLARAPADAGSQFGSVTARAAVQVGRGGGTATSRGLTPGVYGPVRVPLQPAPVHSTGPAPCGRSSIAPARRGTRRCG